MDISAFTEPESFKKTTGNILRELRASRKMPGQMRIYTAGEKEYYNWLERKDKGVAFTDELLEEFRGLCNLYDLKEYLPYFEG
jgi:LDH2 family malate/lactate/ureidoglycolate dehydrogenase